MSLTSFDLDTTFEQSARRLYKSLGALTTAVFLLMMLGSLVRNMGAGLSCPDWPLCHGQLIPSLEDPRVFVEWFHRLIASMVSFGLLGISIAVYRNRIYRGILGNLNFAAIGLLLCQVLLGGLTVIGLLKGEIVTAHLAVGFLFFATLLWMTLRTRTLAQGKMKTVAAAKFSRFAVISAGVVYFQVLLGGMVASHYAGLACLDFPTCNGSWVPVLQGNVLLQFLHRVGALLVFLKVSVLVAKSFRTELSNTARNWTKIVGILLLLQVCLGIGSVFLRIPLWMSVAHLGTAAALFAALLIVGYETSSR